MKVCVVAQYERQYEAVKKSLEALSVRVIRQEYKKDVYEEDIEKYCEKQAIQGVTEFSGGKPVLVLQAVLYFEGQEFPGVLTEKLWEQMQEEDWNLLFDKKQLSKKMVLTYTDGKTIKTFSVVQKGRLETANKQKGHWEDFFVAEGDKAAIEILWQRFQEYFITTSLPQKWKSGKEEKEKIIDTLAELACEKKLILFVGAGVSANLGIPTWNELMDYIAQDETIGYHPELFKQMGNELELMEYYGQCENGIEDLKQWMCREWNEKDVPKECMKIHQCIVDLGFPIIYTTNFEHWIEKAFMDSQEVEVISTVEDMQKMKRSSTEIIKFHGDCEKTSLVLTESNHFERLDFESALDIRFRADLLNHSILFIGYSLSDMNVRYMLYKMQKMREKFMGGSSMPNIYILTHRYNEVKQEVLRKRGIITIYQDEKDRGEGLYRFLKRIYDRVKAKNKTT